MFLLNQESISLILFQLLQTPERTEVKATDTKVSKEVSLEGSKPVTASTPYSKSSSSAAAAVSSSPSGGGGNERHPSFRSRTDSVIEYTPPMVGEAAGSTFYITKTGYLDYVVLLKVSYFNLLIMNLGLCLYSIPSFFIQNAISHNLQFISMVK